MLQMASKYMMARSYHQRGSKKPCGLQRKIDGYHQDKAWKLKLFGRIAWIKGERLLKLATFSKVLGKIWRGRPSRRWMDDITDWCQAEL